MEEAWARPRSNVVMCDTRNHSLRLRAQSPTSDQSRAMEYYDEENYDMVVRK